MENYKNIEQKLLQNTQQMEQLLVKLDESRRENEFLQDKTLKAESEIGRLQNELFTNSKEK